MPSLKSHLVALFLRHTRKKAFSSAEEMNRWIAAARKVETHRPPADFARRLAVSEREIDGFPVYEVAPRGGAQHRERILYLHGGAYVFEITRYHWRLIAEMAERLGARITVPIYPIAPQHDFHAMFGMAMKTYSAMADEPGDIVFMGDSAGGNMAVVMTMMAAEKGWRLPSRHVLISPGLDMSLSNPAIYDVEKRDPWLGIPGGLEAIRHYSAGIDTSDWRISPIYGDLSVLPPMLILTGTRDLLYPDTVAFTEKARAAGVDVDLVVEPGMVHVWPLIEMPETRRARDRMIAFLDPSPQTSPHAAPARRPAAPMQNTGALRA